MRYTTSSGLVVTDRRDRSSDDVVPNDNDPASVPPATVGPPAVSGGDPNGVEIISVGTPRQAFPTTIVPSQWSGWPDLWSTPNWWGRSEELTDIAWTCVDLNARVVSIMPPYLVGAAPSTPAGWLSNPDPDRYNSWIDFAKALLWDYQLGEAFVLPTARYSTGYPARFHVVAPWLIQVEMAVGGRRRYTIGSADVSDDILHIPYQIRSDEPRGHGPLEAGRARLIAAQLLNRYAANVAAAGGIPNSVLKHPATLTASQARELQEQWVVARQSAMGLPAVLSGGLEFQTLQLSPTDMALVELSRMNENRIAVMLGVPPFLVGLPSGGDSMTYSNVSQIFDYHWRASLSTFASTCMAALSGWALPTGTSVEVNRDEYVKPDPLTRAQTEQIYVQLGVLTAEQVAEFERFSIAAPTPTLTSGVLQ